MKVFCRCMAFPPACATWWWGKTGQPGNDQPESRPGGRDLRIRAGQRAGARQTGASLHRPKPTHRPGWPPASRRCSIAPGICDWSWAVALFAEPGKTWTRKGTDHARMPQLPHYPPARSGKSAVVWSRLRSEPISRHQGISMASAAARVMRSVPMPHRLGHSLEALAETEPFGALELQLLTNPGCTVYRLNRGPQGDGFQLAWREGSYGA